MLLWDAMNDAQLLRGKQLSKVEHMSSTNQLPKGGPLAIVLDKVPFVEARK